MSESIWSLVSRTVMGWRLLRKKIHNKDYVTLVTSDAFGDTAMLLSFVRRYQQKTGKEVAIICTPSKVDFIDSWFEDVSFRKILVSKEQSKAIIRFLQTDVGLLFQRRHRESLKCVYSPAWIKAEIIKDGITVADNVSVVRAAYGLSKDVPPEAPVYRTDNAEKIAESVHLLKGKSIILEPFSNTIRVPFPFYEKLANELISSGYTVFTDVSSGEKAVSGTQEIRFDLKDAGGVIEYAGTVIGSRSGFFDYIVFCRANILSIDNNYYGLSDYNSLQMWKPGGNVREYRYMHGAEQKVIAAILRDLNDILGEKPE